MNAGVPLPLLTVGHQLAVMDLGECSICELRVNSHHKEEKLNGIF